MDNTKEEDQIYSQGDVVIERSRKIACKPDNEMKCLQDSLDDDIKNKITLKDLLNDVAMCVEAVGVVETKLRSVLKHRRYNKEASDAVKGRPVPVTHIQGIVISLSEQMGTLYNDIIHLGDRIHLSNDANTAELGDGYFVSKL